MEIKQIYFDKLCDGVIAVDIDFYDKFNVENSVLSAHVFDIVKIDEYYLIVDIKRNKTIKVFKNYSEVVEFFNQYGNGAPIKIEN